MTTSTATERLRNDHDRVRGILTELERYLEGQAPPQDALFARLRWSLVRELSLHLAFERDAYPRIVAEPRGPALYRGLDVRLDADLATHMADWTAPRIAREWPAYRVEARDLARRLRRRMAYEETVIFPMMT